MSRRWGFDGITTVTRIIIFAIEKKTVWTDKSLVTFNRSVMTSAIYSKLKIFIDSLSKERGILVWYFWICHHVSWSKHENGEIVHHVKGIKLEWFIIFFLFLVKVVAMSEGAKLCEVLLSTRRQIGLWKGIAINDYFIFYGCFNATHERIIHTRMNFRYLQYNNGVKVFFVRYLTFTLPLKFKLMFIYTT